MENLGFELVRGPFKSGGVIGLQGDLGAGKTTLVRGMARGLGISDITSPSFNYYFLYKGSIPLLHLDAYRLNTPADYASLMIEELLTPKTLFAIEWPEKLGPHLPPNIFVLGLEMISENARRVKAL